MNNIADEFDRIYKEYYSAVFKYFAARANANDAEDLAQQTFMRLWGWLPCIDSIKSKKAVIFKIAKFVLIDYIRLKSTTEISVNEKAISTATDDFTRYIELSDDINNMTERCKQIIYLKSAGYNSREIGSLLGISGSTIRTYLERIKKAIK